MALRLKGSTSGSVELNVPAAVSGGDVSLTLPNGTGSANQFLKNGSAAGTLEFSALALTSSDMPTGSILQVVEASTSTEVDVATTTYTDTGLSQSITPSSTSSKILVIVDQVFKASSTVASVGGGIRLLRGSTVIHDPITNTVGPFDFFIGGVASFYDRVTITQLDSPATTSAVTYKTQGRPYTNANSGKLEFQFNSSNVNGTSYITLIEVAG